jgi:phosphate transport system substrate-binding protein
MRKTALLVVSILLSSMLMLVGCNPAAPTNTGGSGGNSGGDAPAAASGKISVITREDGSGTRSAFIELFGVQDENKVDQTTTSAVTTNSTAVMLTTVAGDPRAIGYISMGSMSDSVKALAIDGTAATTANVKNGSYKIQRPFNIVTKGGVSDAAQDFIDFIMSSDGQKVVEDNHYITVDEAAPAFSSNGASGQVVVAGSSSVTPVMEKLKEAYTAVNPNVKIEIQTTDSSSGIKATGDGTCDIGMASRELKDSETASGLEPTVIAKDGIAVIVNLGLPVDSLTSAQVKAIFTGDASRWEDL